MKKITKYKLIKKNGANVFFDLFSKFCIYLEKFFSKPKLPRFYSIYFINVFRLSLINIIRKMLNIVQNNNYHTSMNLYYIWTYVQHYASCEILMFNK
jgi:hypothetical protein